MPPPQADHKEIAQDKNTRLANFTREELFVTSISDPLSWKIRVRSKFFV